MSEFWKQQNLNGNGLQTINQEYTRLKRDSKTAYLLCLFFPLGAHQFYLKAPLNGLLFLSISILSVVAFFYSPLTSLVIFLCAVGLVAIDIKNTDKRVVNFNKQLKIQLSLQSNNAAPKNFRGRYHDDSPIDDYLSIKKNEITAFETKKNKSTNESRIFSFDEQEKLLKEMNKKRPKKVNEKEN